MFLTLACLGCTKRISFGPEGELRDAREVLARVDAAEAKVISLRGDGRLDVDSKDARGGVGLFLSVSRPALLHLEPLDFFNRPQGVLVSDGTTFWLYSVPESVVLTGPASPPNVSRLLPIVIPATELVSVMLGQAPRIDAESVELAVDEAQRTYRLTLTRGQVVQTLWVHPEHFRVLRSEVRGAPAYDLQFSDFLTTAQVAVPRRIVLASQAGEARLELRYKDVEVNGSLDLTDFEFEAPEGIPVTRVDAFGRAIDAASDATPVAPDADIDEVPAGARDEASGREASGPPRSP